MKIVKYIVKIIKTTLDYDYTNKRIVDIEKKLFQCRNKYEVKNIGNNSKL